MRKFLIVCLFIVAYLFGYHRFSDSSANISYVDRNFKLEVPFEQKLLNDFSLQYRLFKKAKLESGRFVYSFGDYRVFFTVDPLLQSAAEEVFRTYRLKYGAFVAIDPETGRVLCALSSLDFPDLTVKRSFPAASTFKIVTAAAALESGIADTKSRMVCGGVSDSCSPTVWLKSRYMVVRDMKSSFANSANPYFGNLGRIMGKSLLLSFARRFGFNREDMGFPWGKVYTPVDDYQLALTAAGLQNSRVSPFHEALISATILNGGVMPKPTLIERIERKGKVVYSFSPSSLGKVVSSSTAKKLNEMMFGTCRSGTASQKKFFRLFRRRFRDFKVGGKTGTLSELTYPEGRCEWFVGYFEGKGLKLAVASLAVNGSRYYITGYDISPLVVMKFIKGRKAECVSSAR